MDGFFDNVSKNASKTFKTIKVKSEIVVESVKIKRQISDFKSHINILFFDIGKSFYNSFKENDISDEKMEELKKSCQEILKFEEKISGLEKELKNLDLKEKIEIYDKRIVGKCPNCGNPINKGDKFCTKCGQKIEFEIINDESNKTLCPNCSKEIPEGYKFCPECGTPIKENNI